MVPVVAGRYRRIMSKKLPPEVRKHIHGDSLVTPERVDAFFASSREVQLRVFGVLRERANDQSGTIQLSLSAVVISLIVVIYVPTQHSVAPNGDWASVIAACIALALVAAFVILPLALGPIWTHERQQNANVWLGAYQDELAVRSLRSQPARNRWFRRS